MINKSLTTAQSAYVNAQAALKIARDSYESALDARFVQGKGVSLGVEAALRDAWTTYAAADRECGVARIIYEDSLVAEASSE